VIDDVRTFIEAAMAIGLGPRLEALTADVEVSIQAYPEGADRRYLHRLENQLDRLRNPDLRLAVAIARELCAEEPSRLEILRPAIAPLAARHPYLANLLLQVDQTTMASSAG
jgi:hypothetical protein